MTYGKANPASRYMRSHPYRREPCGSPRPDEEVKTGDLWKAFGTIKNYVVSSVSQFVLRLTGSKKPETKDDSTSTSDRVNGDALRENPIYPNQLNANVFSARQRLGYGETDPRVQMLLPPYQRPFVQHQSHYPYLDDRPQGLPYRPMNPRRRNMIPDVSPYVVKPYTYRRAWTSTAKSNARMSRLPNPNPFNNTGWAPSKKRTTSYTDIDTTTLRHNYSPIYPRKLFSWERCRSKIEYKHEEGEQGESKVTLTYTDPSIQRAIDRAQQAEGTRMEEKKGLLPTRSFGARVIRSPNDDQTQKRKTYKARGPESNSKRPRSLDIKGKSGNDLTITRCHDVDSMPMNDSQSNSDVSMESEQKQELCSDKVVGDIEVKEAPNQSSLKQVSSALPGSSIQSSSLFGSTSKASKPASCQIFDSNISTKNKSGLFDDVVANKTLKPVSPSLSGPFSLPERKERETIPLFKANQSEDTVSKAKPMVKSKKDLLETEKKEISSTSAAAPQKALEPAADENISFACRMGRLKRIKIRDHYIQKIESLYDSKCTTKDKDAKKMKAVSMYKEKYHKLQDDHAFYTKLCKNYNVDPGEEYVGVDPDIKPEQDEPAEEKKEKPAKTFSFELKADPKPQVHTKLKIDTKPAVSKPHINPFETDSIKPAEQPAPTGFTFSGNLFSGGPPKPAKGKRGREGDLSANLFDVTTKPDLFSATQSPTTTTTTNLFSPAAAAAAGSPSSSLFNTNPGKAKNNLFNSTNGALKSTGGGLFGMSSTAGGTASMDSDVPSGNSTFGFSNAFASKPGQTSNINPFDSTSNPFNMQQGASSGSFGNTQRIPNAFNTSSSGGAFGKPGAFNPGGLGKGDGPVFSLGNLSGGKNKKRRTIVRGRRTLP